LYDKDEVRALFVLVQNPVFAAQPSYTIFAHLLRQIVNLSSSDHQLLIYWFKM
jgi:E3 ubiquitin-protein ligase HECTD2